MNTESSRLAPKTGAELIAEVIAQRCNPSVFLVTGGAAAFMIDALGQNPSTDYVCFQHEQAAAMGADAVWRTNRLLGVTMCTSGPGATNLITGIASSWFDSIPALHITGQVNDRESKTAIGANVRQAGFQETDIVSMVSTITKSATKVQTVRELAVALRDGIALATSGRMGPVLIDVPMNVQQQAASAEDLAVALGDAQVVAENELPVAVAAGMVALITNFISGAERPLVVFGGGMGLAGAAKHAQSWCEENEIPYIASWAGMTFIDRSKPGYQGTHGVYGLRHANWCAQAADRILVLGSRLDNRQRTGNPRAYAPFADFLVLDIDDQEIAKFGSSSRFDGIVVDLKFAPSLLSSVKIERPFRDWMQSVLSAGVIQDSSLSAYVGAAELDPYKAVAALQKHFLPNTLVVADTGATLCWTFQGFQPDDSYLFTAGGNSPMGYSLPAAIGAQIADRDIPVVCIIGDGGFQMNIQELQTAVAYDTPITIVIFNNTGYGIIKQFQDSNMEGRYAASGRGYTVPDLGRIAHAYGIDFHRVTKVSQITDHLLSRRLKIIELVIPEKALATPKAEGDHFVHDQFPYQLEKNPSLPVEYPAHPSQLALS